MSFSMGETVGRYRITEQLGQGGMATVYRAYDASLDRYVAIKVMHQAFKEDTSFLARFQREAQIVAKLRHPHIVAVHEFAEHKGQSYLVMEFIEGETLKARLKRAPLSLDEIVAMMRAVSEALTYAHEKGVLHRDIKPSNILLDNNGTPYLTDFGLARMVQAGESTLSKDMMLGTPQYISPEQAQGVRVLGPETDIYSLGIVLYQLIVGRVPFSADTPYAIIHDHIYKPLPLPTSINPNVPPEIERVLLKALAKEPPDRFPSAQAMAAAFQRAVEEAQLQELPPPAPQPAPRAAAFSVTPQPTPAIPAAMPTSTPGGVATVTPAWLRRKRRGEQLWMLGGLAAFVFTCLLGLFVAVAAITDSSLRPAAALPEATATAAPTAAANLPEIPLVEVQAARALVEQNPDDPGAHFALALALLHADNLAAAELQYRRAAGLPATTPYYILAAAEQASELGFENQALALTAQVFGDIGSDPVLRDHAGALLYDLASDANRLDITVFSRLAEAHPASGGAQAMLTRALTAMSRFDEAQAAIDEALELDGALPETHLILGDLYAATDRPSEAEAEWRYARTASGAPQWVITQANLLLSGNTR